MPAGAELVLGGGALSVGGGVVAAVVLICDVTAEDVLGAEVVALVGVAPTQTVLSSSPHEIEDEPGSSQVGIEDVVPVKMGEVPVPVVAVVSAPSPRCCRRSGFASVVVERKVRRRRVVGYMFVWVWCFWGCSVGVGWLWGIYLFWRRFMEGMGMVEGLSPL